MGYENYVVREDDTAMSLALRFDMPLSFFLRLNGLNEGSLLPPGRVVQVKSKKAPVPVRPEKPLLSATAAANQDVECAELKKNISYCCPEGRVKGVLTITPYFLCFEIEHTVAYLKNSGQTPKPDLPARYQCFIDMHDVLQCRYFEQAGKPFLQLFISLRTSHPVLAKAMFRLSKKSVTEMERLTLAGVAEEAANICRAVLGYAESARNEEPQGKTHLPFYEEYFTSGGDVNARAQLSEEEAASGSEEYLEEDELPSEEGSALQLPSLAKSDAPLFFGHMKAKVLSIHSEVLTEKMYIALRRELPKIYQLRNWKLVYSPIEHGNSLRTMYRNACEFGATLLLVKDATQTVFGAFVSEPWRVTKKYYGTGESFLFTFKTGTLRTFRPTLLNEYYIISDLQSVMFGAGVRSGLFISSDLVKGSSGYSDTYGNTELSQGEDFKIVDLELWGFI